MVRWGPPIANTDKRYIRHRRDNRRDEHGRNKHGRNKHFIYKLYSFISVTLKMISLIYLNEQREQTQTMTQTNPRYKTFCQSIFTAGDKEQFEQRRNKYTTTNDDDDVRDNDDDTSNINGATVTQTFNYLFDKFKKGLVIQTRDRELSVFLPFSKHAYINEWHSYLTVSPEYTSFEQLFDHVSQASGYKKTKTLPVSQWYANNALFRHESPIRENESGIPILYDMFKTLCETRKVPNVEFFVNKRDHPLLREDRTEAYDTLFPPHTPLVSHGYDKYAPILSMCYRKGYADIPIPTWDDWSRCCILENKTFSKSPYQLPFDHEWNVMDWSERTPTAVFRGASNGFGITPDTNMRLKVSYLSLENEVDVDGIPLLDAGITKWNLRPRCVAGVVDTFSSRVRRLPLKPFLTRTQQCTYKYIINIDGHVSAYRLSMELDSGSVVLLVESEYALWFESELKPYEHYVPIKSDLSDLLSQIRWCKQHDTECQQIVANAKQFYATRLTKNGLLDYLESLLWKLKRITGTYVYAPSPLLRQFKEEASLVQSYPKTHIPSDLPPIDCLTHPLTTSEMLRTYDVLCALGWVMYRNGRGEEGGGGCVWSESVPINNKKRKLTLHTLKGTAFQCIQKDIQSDNERNHETFVGLYCINSLIKKSPHFMYTLGCDENAIRLEYVKGPTFLHFLQTSFTFSEYVSILYQIANALHVAQQDCLFIHYDLYPWNIVLRSSETGGYIPVLIDYGKSRVVYNNKYYGIVKPYANGTVHDILCILFSSMSVLLDNSRTAAENASLLRLSTFFSPSTFTNDKRFTTIGELKQVLDMYKKFDVMIDCNKYELNTRTPQDFMRFLETTFSYRPTPTKNEKRWKTPRLIYLQLGLDDDIKSIYIKQINKLDSDSYAYAYLELKRIADQLNVTIPLPTKDIIYKTFPVPTSDNRPITMRYTTTYNLDTFDDPDKVARLSMMYEQMDIPTNLHALNQIAAQYHHPPVYEMDTVAYLQALANKTTFLDIIDI
jgi:hypothetical protein